jgi:hypothetical protein
MALAQKSPTLDVISKIRSYTKKDGNQVGGNLHMVLSDKNINDSDIEFCRKQAEDVGDAEGVELAELLLALSKTGRMKACSNW